MKPFDNRKYREFANIALKEPDNDFKTSSSTMRLTIKLSILIEENFEIIYKKPLRSAKLIVWCGFWSDGIICPYFFRNETVNTVTVIEEQYRAMVSNIL